MLCTSTRTDNSDHPFCSGNIASSILSSIRHNVPASLQAAFSLCPKLVHAKPDNTQQRTAVFIVHDSTPN